MKHGIMFEDEHGNIGVILVPPNYATDTNSLGDLRDVLEMTFDYDTRGIAEVITLTEAKKRARKASQS